MCCVLVVSVGDYDIVLCVCSFFFFQAEDGIRDLVRSRGLGDVYKRQQWASRASPTSHLAQPFTAA